MPLDLETEEWRDIPDVLGYQVSDLGRVRSFWRRTSTIAGSTFDKWKWAITDEPKILPLPLDVCGYRTVRLSKDGRQRLLKVHCLVLLAFVGKRPTGLQGRHLNDDKENNRLSNLGWGTTSQNMQERHTNRDTPVFALTPQNVTEIRTRLMHGERQRSVAQQFNVHPSLVSRIKNGKRWAFV